MADNRPRRRLGPKAAIGDTGLSAGWIAFAIFAATCLVFSPALRNGFVNWDDPVNFLENVHYRAFHWANLRWMFTNIVPGPYQPLSWLSLAVDYSLWGLNPAGYHLTSVLLHAANAVVYFLLGRRLLRLAKPELPETTNLIAAAVAALWFAVHPLRVESVVWATERRDVLSGLFFLLTLDAYLRSRSEARGGRWYLISLAWFTLSLLAKGIGVTMPLVLLILDYYPLRRRLDQLKSALLEKVPYALLAALFAAVGVLSQFRSGAAASLRALGPTERLAQCFFGLAFYFEKTIWPAGLSPMYARPPDVHLVSPLFAAPAAAVLIAGAGLLAVRNRFPALIAASAYYLVVLLPVLGLIPLGAQLAADRYSYLACLAWPLLAAGALAVKPRLLPSLGFAGAGFSALLAVATVRQIAAWHDSEALWRRALSVSPDNHIAHNYLANVLIGEGRIDEGLAQAEEALRLAPGYGDAHANLGSILMQRGDARGAIEHYRAAVAAAPDKAAYAYNLGVLLAQVGRTDEAIEQYRASLRLDPARSDAHSNLGVALAAKGRFEEAISEYQEALRLSPGSVSAHNNLAVAYAARSRFSDAIAEFGRALEISPGDPVATKNRAWLLDHVKAGRRTAASKTRSARPD